MANLSNTEADIDPQKILFKSLAGTNLTGLNLYNKDFTGVSIYGANLRNTGAKTEEEIMDKFIGTVKKLVKARNTKAN